MFLSFLFTYAKKRQTGRNFNKKVLSAINPRIACFQEFKRPKLKDVRSKKIAVLIQAKVYQCVASSENNTLGKK